MPLFKFFKSCSINLRGNKTRENIQELRILYNKLKILTTTIEEKDFGSLYPDRYSYTAISDIDPQDRD
jgi:hypothetical protein